MAPSSGEDGREVDVVADQHGRAGGPVLVEPAAAVGQHQGRGAGGCGRAHAVDHGAHALALVEVGAGAQHQHVFAGGGADGGQGGHVAHHGGRGETGHVRGVHRGGHLANESGRLTPAGAQHHGNVVVGNACVLGNVGCGLAGQLGGI